MAMFSGWCVLFLALPPLLEMYGVIPRGTQLLPRLFLAPLLLLIPLKKPAFRVGFVLVVLGALLSLYGPPTFRKVMEGMNYRLQDAFFSLRGPRKPSGKIVLVDVDEKSLKELGQWPWPRTHTAKLLAWLKGAHPSGIGLDILFAEPDRQSLSWWREKIAEMGGKVVGVSTEETDNDAALAKEIADDRVVVGGFFVTEGGSREGKARQESQGMVVSAAIIGAQQVFPGLRRGIEQVLNLPIIQEAAHHQGAFNLIPDASGAARFYTMLMEAPVYQKTLVNREGESQIVVAPQWYTYPSLVLELFRIAEGYEEVSPGFKNEQRGLYLRGQGGRERFIPLDFKGDAPLDYLGYGGRWRSGGKYGPDYYFPYYSFADVLLGRVPLENFRDKYVLIGSTDPTLSDLVGSPFRAAFPGLEVHATMLDNLVTEHHLVDVGSWATVWLSLAILGVGGLVVMLIAYGHPWISGAMIALTLIGWPALGYWGLAHGGWLINPVYPWLSLSLAFMVTLLISYLTEGKEKRFVISHFATMVSAEVLEKLKERPEECELDGQRAEVSVVFTDLQGFTSFAEKIAPQTLVQILNRYFTPMADLVMAHGGFVDKFIGDSIMSCWGVPYPDPLHAQKACQCVLEQRKTLEDISAQIRRDHGVDIVVRTGIASGVVSAAFIGSHKRKDYTVIGDVVNQSARLESVCRHYGVSMVVTEDTVKEAGRSVVTRCLDRLLVKGKTQPVPVYELVGERESLPMEVLEKIMLFEEALFHHWNREWEEALTLLGKAVAIDPHDGPSRNLQERIRRYQESPPPLEWQGEVLTSVI